MRGRHDPPVHMGDMGIPQRPHPRTLVPMGRTRAVLAVQRDGQRVARMAQRRRHAPHVGCARDHEHPAHRPALLDASDRDHRRRPPGQTRQDHRQGRRPRWRARRTRRSHAGNGRHGTGPDGKPAGHPHADGRTGAGQGHGTCARRPAGPLPVRPAGPGGNRRESGKEGGSGGHPVRPGPLMALRDVRDHDVRKAHGVHNPHGPHGPGPCGPGPCGPGPHGPETRDGSQGPAGPGGRGSCGPRRT